MTHDRRRRAANSGSRVRMEPRLVAVLLILVLVLAAIGVTRIWASPVAAPVSEGVSEEAGAPDPAESGWSEAESAPGPAVGAQSAQALLVYVTGAVADPGVKRLREGDRVVDALESAGGALPGAALDSINLARLLVDGEQIDVPTVEEAAAASLGGGGAAGAGAGGPSPPCIDLNTADASQLEELDGVGPALAAHILAHREQNGPFSGPEALLEVSGIGEKKLAAIEGELCP